MSSTIVIALFIIGVLASVAFHEAGHFVAARRFGMAVSDFSVGFGKPIATYRRNGIAYRLRLLPLGGFVKIHGMRPSEALPEDPNGVKYVERPAWQRVIVAAAGPGANVVLAWAIIAALLLSMTTPVLTTTLADAGPAGLDAGDEILAVDGAPVASGDEVAAAVDAASGPVAVDVERAGTMATVTVDDAAALPKALTVDDRRIPVTKAAGGAATLLWSTTTSQLRGMAEVLAPEALAAQLHDGFTGEERTGNGVVSIVGVGQIAASEADSAGSIGESLFAVVALIAALNVVLAVFNLIPITPLDGGHIALAAIEGSVSKVRSRFGATGAWFLPRPLVTGLTVSAFGLLLGLGVSLIALDILNPVQIAG